MANRILINGKIWTENKAMPWAEAVVIEGKKFAFVGNNEEAEKYAAEQKLSYETIDLDGKTVLPGLIDGHTHIATMAKATWVVFGEKTADKDELYANVKKYAELYPKEERPYFVYDSYMNETFGDKGPHKRDLDAIISDRPARMNDDSGHGCLYNSMAIEMLKNEEGVPYSFSPIPGQSFDKDENGEYTGWAHQTFPTGDIGIFQALGWMPSQALIDEIAEPAHDSLRCFGVVSYMDGVTESEEDMQYLSQLDKEDRLNFYYEATSCLISVDDVDEAIAKAKDWQAKYDSDHIHTRIIKFFGDGSNEFGDVLSLRPFSNDPEGKNYGHCNFTVEQMKNVMLKINAAGLDLHVHCCCDGTFRQFVDAYEAAKKECKDEWVMRFTMAHIELFDPEDLRRAIKLGIYFNTTPNWNGSGGYDAIPFIGRDRFENQYNYRIAMDEDANMDFSSDNMNPRGFVRQSPYLGIQIGITRIDPMWPLDPAEYPYSFHPPKEACFTLEQMIHGYTIAGAKRMRLDDKIGSIEAGKMACLVVLDKDIFTIPHEEIAEIAPVCHYFDGKELHSSNPLKDGRITPC